jgi:hypothetical protein
MAIFDTTINSLFFIDIVLNFFEAIYIDYKLVDDYQVSLFIKFLPSILTIVADVVDINSI